MIIDGVSYREFAEKVLSESKYKIILPFVELIERKLGAKVIFDLQNIPFGRYDLADPLQIAYLFKKEGILEWFGYVDPLPDEPPFRLWKGSHGKEAGKQVGGGSLTDDRAALFAVLGEALERYLWRTQQDYFVKSVHTTSEEIARKGAFIDPRRFSGFSSEQRGGNPEWKLNEDSSFLWIQGVSLITSKKTYVPAQTASAAISPRHEREPTIRMQTTVGLATWPTLAEARLKGALEVIERDAYMIMWLNQLTLPRIALAPLRSEHPAIDMLLKRCEQYRLKVHAIRMLTDAPTHAICVVLEDESWHAPRFAFGLKAHRSLPRAIEGAALEALRARRSYRKHFQNGGTWDPNTPVEKIGHRERTYYWGHGDNAKQLEFLIEGEEKETSAEWENDTPEQHLQRIIDWCKKSQYECVSVSLGKSAKNPTPWSVEMVVMPDLQATYLRESLQHLGGTRLKSIPEKFGYTSRPEPHTDTPHPYC